MIDWLDDFNFRFEDVNVVLIAFLSQLTFFASKMRSKNAIRRWVNYLNIYPVNAGTVDIRFTVSTTLAIKAHLLHFGDRIYRTN